MATTPSEIELTNNTYTRIVNNQAEYLIQNGGGSIILVIGSDTDLGARTNNLNGGYRIVPISAIDNTQLKDYAYVYAKSITILGKVLV